MKPSYRFAQQRDYKKIKLLDPRPTTRQFSALVKSRQIIVAALQKEIIGYLRLEFIWLKIPYISWVHVKKENQQAGVAKGLFRFLCQYLKRKKYKFILSSFQENTPVSKKWHAKMGFRRCGKIASINEDGAAELFCLREL